MLLVGYFEEIQSQRGIAWRCVDSLSIRQFLAEHVVDLDSVVILGVETNE
jgi:hypothetical protein